VGDSLFRTSESGVNYLRNPLEKPHGRDALGGGTASGSSPCLSENEGTWGLLCRVAILQATGSNRILLQHTTLLLRRPRLWAPVSGNLAGRHMPLRATVCCETHVASLKRGEGERALPASAIMVQALAVSLRKSGRTPEAPSYLGRPLAANGLIALEHSKTPPRRLFTTAAGCRWEQGWP
jgi:hypothetical protein